MSTVLHAGAGALLRAWDPPTTAQRALREAFLGLLAARPDACQRSCTPGHLTASAVVLDTTGEHTCLVHHGIVGAWLQPGGHLEATDEDLAGAARREAQEETGLADLVVDPAPLLLDVHPITCRGSAPTRHFDVRFVAVAPLRQPTASAESHDVRWFPVDELPPTFDEVGQTVREAVTRLGAGGGTR